MASSPPAGTLSKAALLLSLFLGLLSSACSLSIGVNYGANADNLPPPAQAAAFLRQQTLIDRVKLFDCNPDFIRAFAGTGIALAITAANADIPALSKLPAARAWVQSNVAPFYPATNISLVLAGNEVLFWNDRNLIAHLVPAMRSVSAALAEAGYSRIRVSTPHAFNVFPVSEPPSSARFRRGYDKAVFYPMLEFHNQTKTPFMVNPYPYFGYNGRVDYALFRPNAGLFDPVTRVNYTDMFTAQLDAAHAAVESLGFGNVEIAVGETGWPSKGDAGQVGVGPEEAAEYVGNVIRVVDSGKGTPRMPNRRFETYIFSLFNEDLKPGPTVERNWGLFKPDLTPVYDVGLMRTSAGSGPARAPAPAGSAAGEQWCVAKADADPAALQASLDYACGSGVLDCGPIQAEGTCFDPDTLVAHASYAMNAYFQANGRHDFDCNFSGTAVLTSSDPSYGTCKYPV